MYRYEGLPPTGTGIQTDIVGWKERYYQFKRKMPKALAFFAQNGRIIMLLMLLILLLMVFLMVY